MKKFFKEIFKVDNIPYLVLSLIMFLSFANINIKPGDDEWFSTILNKSFDDNLIKYLKERYIGWTGRIVIEFIMVPMFGCNIWIWRCLNTIVSVVLAFGIYNLIPYNYISKIEESERLLIKSLICISIFAIPTEVFSASISWITGSYNYLWPVACLLLMILPYKKAIFKEYFNRKWYFVLIFITILGANMEQASLVILVFALITNIYITIRDNKIRKDLLIFNIFIAINTAILFLAPGNYERSNKEILTWFGQWDMISLPTKLMMGINLFLEHTFESNIILIVMLFVLVNILIWKEHKSVLIKVLGIIPLFISIIKVIEKNIHILNINNNLLIFRLLNVQNLNILNFDDIKLFLPTFILLFTILIIPVLFLFIFDNTELKYLSIILYLAAICSALSISISPTIYASGPRIFFLTDILIIVIIGLILSELLKKWRINILIILISIFVFVGNNFTMCLNNILNRS